MKDPSAVPFESAHDGLSALARENLTADHLRTAFLRNADWSPDLTGDQFRMRPGGLRKASVMLALLPVERQGSTELELILTKRASTLREHSGQIALPGGRVDDTDVSDEAAALREGFEEIGLPVASVEVLGQLNRYVTGTGFDVAPVVGLVSSPFTPRLSEGEVAEMFTVPLSFIMNPHNHRRHVIEIPESEGNTAGKRTFFSIPFENYFIWGATAAVLRNFYRMLSANTSACGLKE